LGFAIDLTPESNFGMKLNKKRLVWAGAMIPLAIAIIGIAGKKPTEAEKAREYVTFLSSDDLEGRGIGTAGEEKAASYIADRFFKLGLKSAGDNDTWFQHFDFVPKSNPHVMPGPDGEALGQGMVKKISGRNVLARIDNQAENTIIIGAHFDHLGWGDENSLFKGEKAIHHGADDNGSGVAAMLVLAERLKKSKLKGNNYLFIAFSGEEKGLWGSNHFCKNPLTELTKVNYMLNMDMVGRLDAKTKKLALYGTGTSPVWDAIVEKQKGKFELIKDPSGVGPSDHTSFYLQDIPVLHFFTGQHEDYHRPSDTAEKLNYEGIVEVVDFMERIIKTLNKSPKLPFTKTQDKDSQKSPKFSVTMGVVPDYMFSGEGMRVDGVSEDKPAARAGILKGDIIIQLGDSTITDMMSYMRALSSFAKGDTTRVRINRNGEIQKLPVEFK